MSVGTGEDGLHMLRLVGADHVCDHGDQRPVLSRQRSTFIACRLSCALAAVLTALALLACQPKAAPFPTLEPESPGITYPEIAGRRVITREVVNPPQPAPPFRLTDQVNRPFSLSDLEGRIVILSFIYTHCPDACPLLAANYLQVQREFPEAMDQEDLALIFVTVDPERDTPERLAHYTNGLGGRWLFLTGSMAEVEEVWRKYDVHREVRERTKELVVFHSYKTYLIDRKGKIRFKHIGVWYPQDIIPDIRMLLEESGQ